MKPADLMTAGPASSAGWFLFNPDVDFWYWILTPHHSDFYGPADGALCGIWGDGCTFPSITAADTRIFKNDHDGFPLQVGGVGERDERVFRHLLHTYIFSLSSRGVVLVGIPLIPLTSS
jgi:hypothetical protein